MITTQTFVEILQSSIAPVFLISGFGIIMNGISNRFSRIIDRIHMLTTTPDKNKRHSPRIRKQISRLYKRARNMRNALTFSAASVLFSALIIITLFMSFMFNISGTNVVVVFFLLGMISLIIALTIYVYDLTLSFDAISIELENYLDGLN